MDFDTPITPGGALRCSAESAEAQAQHLRNKADTLIACAAQLEGFAAQLRHDADSFDQYQPHPPAAGA